jgi:hypothetical protein
MGTAFAEQIGAMLIPSMLKFDKVIMAISFILSILQSISNIDIMSPVIEKFLISPKAVMLHSTFMPAIAVWMHNWVQFSWINIIKSLTTLCARKHGMNKFDETLQRTQQVL